MGATVTVTVTVPGTGHPLLGAAARPVVAAAVASSYLVDAAADEDMLLVAARLNRASQRGEAQQEECYRESVGVG